MFENGKTIMKKLTAFACLPSLKATGLIAAFLAILPLQAEAQVSEETAYVFNTFQFLVSGVLVMWMAAGFAMLESGMVRSKNTAAICLKNIVLYSIAGLMFYIVGYSLMYVDVTGWIGSLGGIFYNPSEAEKTLLGADDATAEMLTNVIGNGYSVSSDWFFQMVFVAAVASIVSGTVAERIKFWPFMIMVAILTGFIYPILSSWTWGGGWLSEMGFSDFAGSTIVHSVGGWAALSGAIILGARKGKYGPDGKVNAIAGANLPLSTLGTFILWLGWFGFNGGSQLALGSAADATAMSIVYVNTNLAAAAGVVAAALMSQIVFKKIDLTLVLNGALGGLVAITAGPDLQNHFLSIIVGGVGGVLVVLSVPLMDKLKVDDVVGAIPVHLICGIWGTLAVAIFGAGSFMVQIVGILAVGVGAFFSTAIIWYILKMTVGLRVSEEAEDLGLDRYEFGLEAYPEFNSRS